MTFAIICFVVVGLCIALTIWGISARYAIKNNYLECIKQLEKDPFNQELIDRALNYATRWFNYYYRRSTLAERDMATRKQVSSIYATIMEYQNVCAKENYKNNVQKKGWQ